MNAFFRRRLAALLALLCPLSAFAGLYEERGYALLASYTGESAFLVDGGQRRGSAYAGQFFVGAEADAGRPFGWTGAKLKLYVASRHGDNLAIDEIGNSVSVQEIWGAQTERLANLTIEQRLFDNRLIVEAGRTVANIHFLGSELCSYFQTNSACGNPTFVFRTSGFTYWPVSSWGGYAKAFITPQIYVHAGVFEVNPLQARDNQHGLNWGIADATGVIAPLAIGYRSSPDTERLPAFYEIGGWRDTSRYLDPLRDASGNAAILSGQPYASRSERSGLFARFEQQLTRPDRMSPRGLVVFGAALWGTSGELSQDRFLELGFVQKGTFAGRPLDSLAFVINRQRYSGAALENLRLQRAALGGGDAPAQDQYLMELSYGVQLTPLLRVAPNLHYIIHPDGFSAPARTRNIDDALVVGLRVDLSLTPAIEAISR